jgi:CRP-like cAMP-binding protein
LALPGALARPWSGLAGLLGVPRVGSAWNLLVCNWRSSTVSSGSAYRPAQLSAETLDLAEQWLPPPYDEQPRCFSLVFVITEAVGAAALPACVEAITAAARRDADRTAAALEELCAVIDDMRGLLARYLRSPLIEPAGWLDYIQPTFPWAVEGDGLSGPNGLQIATIQAIDATLGVPRETALATAASDNRQYLPPAHRRALAAFDAAGPVLASFANESRSPTVKWRYNECLKALRSWRLVHLKRGVHFLRGASGAGPRVSTGVGLQTRHSPASDAASAAGQDAAHEFEQLAADRIEETAAASVVEPPQLAEISSDDIAFAFLSADDRVSLLAGCPIRRYLRGETLTEQGKIRQPVILLESGTARIVIDGIMLEHVRLRAGDVAGEISFLDGPASASVIADDDVEATLLPHGHIHNTLAGQPELAARLYRSLALLMVQRIRRSQQFRPNLTHAVRHPESRYAVHG